MQGSNAGLCGKGVTMAEEKNVVFLLDDDNAILMALGRVLSLSGFEIRTFASVEEFLAAHDPDVPGCLVSDVRMPGMSGLELQSALAARGCVRSIVFITGHGDIRASVQAMKAGAVTFLPKPVQRAELVAAVEEAIQKDVTARAQQREHDEIAKRLATLTPREKQVLELVATGKLNKQIAVELGAAEKTIKVHRGRIMEKMHARTATALVGLLLRAGVQSKRARIP
jgi:FixJ family two-component response regulator